MLRTLSRPLKPLNAKVLTSQLIRPIPKPAFLGLKPSCSITTPLFMKPNYPLIPPTITFTKPNLFPSIGSYLGLGAIALVAGSSDFETNQTQCRPGKQEKAILPDGTILRGIIDSNKGNPRIIEGHITYSEGTKYSGKFDYNGKLTGPGSITYPQHEEISIGHTVELVYKNNKPIIAKNVKFNQEDLSKTEKHLLARFYYALLDSKYIESGYFENITHHIILKLIPDLKPKLPKYKTINSYLVGEKAKQELDPCLLNVTTSNHAFLLGIKPLGDHVELSLYDSALTKGLKKTKYPDGSNKHQAQTCIKKLVKKEHAVAVLKKLNKTKSFDTFRKEFFKNEHLKDVAYDQLQKIQITNSCTLDCWLTYLKHNLPSQKFNSIKAELFKKAEVFFEQEASLTGEYNKKEIRELIALQAKAHEKYTRRVKKIQESQDNIVKTIITKRHFVSKN